MLSANDVALYFLAKTDEDEGDVISHLKLQKLCYYAQGFHLAIFDAPLFTDEIEAWQHGPVVPTVWQEYKQYGSNVIPRPEDYDFEHFAKDSRDLLDEVYDTYGQFSAWKLREMTHHEPPWRDAWEQGPRTPISLESMHQYFSNLVEEDITA